MVSLLVFQASGITSQSPSQRIWTKKTNVMWCFLISTSKSLTPNFNPGLKYAYAQKCRTSMVKRILIETTWVGKVWVPPGPFFLSLQVSPDLHWLSIKTQTMDQQQHVRELFQQGRRRVSQDGLRTVDVLLAVYILSFCVLLCDSSPAKQCDKSCLSGKCINGSCVCDRGWVGDQCQHCQGRFKWVALVKEESICYMSASLYLK